MVLIFVEGRIEPGKCRSMNREVELCALSETLDFVSHRLIHSSHETRVIDAIQSQDGSSRTFFTVSQSFLGCRMRPLADEPA